MVCAPWFRALMSRPAGRFALASACLAALTVGGVRAADLEAGPVDNDVDPHVATVARTAIAPPAPAAPPTVRIEPGAPKPFADVIKGAHPIKGYFTLWQKDEKLWVEVRPDQFDQAFLFSINVTQSVGERGLYGGQMGPSFLATFRRVGQMAQLIARNTEYRADKDPAAERAVRQGFSDSLLGAVPIVSAPHPDTKAVLIDASALLFTDIPAYGQQLDSAFRMGFSFDARNASFTSVRSTDNLTAIGVQAHYFSPRIPAPGTGPYTPPPLTTPDPRSLFVGFMYNFAKLPDAPMHARAADDRVGHFTEAFSDFSSDVKPNNRVYYVQRWRLEKKDPEAALSEPVKPIVFWLDKNIPERYRASVAAGILEWNKAFERIGFKDAIVVRQQAADADWDTMDAGHASVRWFVGADVSFARGPSQTDPRSGEILDADIAMSDGFARASRRFFVEDKGKAMPMGSQAAPAARPQFIQNHHRDQFCDYADELASEMDFAMDLIEARGDIAPDGPEAEAFVQAYIKQVIMHEVGHTLGLRHNFRASAVYTPQQLQDKAFTDKNGVAASVMDYIPFNVAAKGEKQGAYISSTLGPYDYWAIEYAYKPIAPERESQELAAIAGRSNDPLLAYATDDEAGRYADGIDPEVNLFDLGSDPLAYFKKRLELSRELWARAQARRLQAGEDYQTLRRMVGAGFGQLNRVAGLVGKYIGGVTHVRDHAGSGRATFTPIPAKKQKEALDWLTKGLFTSESFRFKPDFLNRLAPNYFENAGDPQFDLTGAVLRLQTNALNKVMSPLTAERVLDQDVNGVGKANVLALSDVYETLQDAIWSELKTGQDIDRLRRNLQREHLRRMVRIITQPAYGMPADAVSLMRAEAVQLQAQLRTAANRRSRLSKEAQAHLAESQAYLSEALRAPMQRYAG